jgi:hypothetical protein
LKVEKVEEVERRRLLWRLRAARGLKVEKVEEVE